MKHELEYEMIFDMNYEMKHELEYEMILDMKYDMNDERNMK